VAYTAHRQAKTEKSSTGSVSDVRKESAGKFKAYSLGCLVEHAIRHFQRAGRAARPALTAVHMTIGIVQLALTIWQLSKFVEHKHTEFQLRWRAC
jgi:hypothetical protein